MNTVLEVKRRETVTLFGSRVRKMEWDGCFSAVTLSPRAKFGQRPSFVSTVLSEHSQAHSGHLSMVIFVPSWQHWVVATGPYGLPITNIFNYLALPRKCTPATLGFSRLQHAESFSISEPLRLLFVCMKMFPQVLQWKPSPCPAGLTCLHRGLRGPLQRSWCPASQYPILSPPHRQIHPSYASSCDLPNPHPLLEGTTWTQVWPSSCQDLELGAGTQQVLNKHWKNEKGRKVREKEREGTSDSFPEGTSLVGK